MLRYFMRNPHITLTSEQICEKAWGMAGSYNRGISHPVRVLRQAIEPDPENPIYIETNNTNLYELDNFIGTPHIGACAEEALERMGDEVVQEVIAVLNGAEPANRVV